MQPVAPVTKSVRTKIVVRLNTQEVLGLLVRKNISKTLFARKIGVELQYVYMLMTHKRNPSAPMRDKIQAVFPTQPWEKLFRIVE